MEKGKGRILVVDDHQPNRLKLALAVKNLGHDAESVASGEECLATLRGSGFDMVLLDIVMPGMDGLWATREQWETDALELPVEAAVDALKAFDESDVSRLRALWSQVVARRRRQQFNRSRAWRIDPNQTYGAA